MTTFDKFHNKIITHSSLYLSCSLHLFRVRVQAGKVVSLSQGRQIETKIQIYRHRQSESDKSCNPGSNRGPVFKISQIGLNLELRILKRSVWSYKIWIQIWSSSPSQNLLEVNFGFFKTPRWMIRMGLVLHIRISLIPLQGWVEHGYRVDVERCR